MKKRERDGGSEGGKAKEEESEVWQVAGGALTVCFQPLAAHVDVAKRGYQEGDEVCVRDDCRRTDTGYKTPQTNDRSPPLPPGATSQPPHTPGAAPHCD